MNSNDRQNDQELVLGFVTQEANEGELMGERKLEKFTGGGLATKPDKFFLKKECLHTGQAEVGELWAMVEECMNSLRYCSAGFQ